MKKLILAAALFSATVSVAQKASNTLTLVKGQTLEVVTNTNITSQSLMGPSSSTITISDSYNVNEASEAGFTLVKVPKQMKIALSTGSQDFQVDSDNPKDLSGPLGQPVKEIMNLKPEFTIDTKGKVVSVKKDGKKKKDEAPDAGMMSMMMPGMNMSGTVPQEGSPSLLQVLPDHAVSVGDTWTDSVAVEGNRSKTHYKVKEISDKEIIVDFENTGSTVSTQSPMGMTIEVNATSTGTGTIIIDKATGIIRQKTVVSNTESAMNLGGREMTFTSKATTVMNVNVK